MSSINVPEKIALQGSDVVKEYLDLYGKYESNGSKCYRISQELNVVRNKILKLFNKLNHYSYDNYQDFKNNDPMKRTMLLDALADEYRELSIDLKHHNALELEAKYELMDRGWGDEYWKL